MKKVQLTVDIESKGYTVAEFLKRIGFSLRWYRTHSKASAARYGFLVKKVDELEVKV